MYKAQLMPWDMFFVMILQNCEGRDKGYHIRKGHIVTQKVFGAVVAGERIISMSGRRMRACFMKMKQHRFSVRYVKMQTPASNRSKKKEDRADC